MVLVETTNGQHFWEALKQWSLTSYSVSEYRIGTGDLLLGIVRKLEEISPLSSGSDISKSKPLRGNRSLYLNGYSDLQVKYPVDRDGISLEPEDHLKERAGERPIGIESVADSYDEQWKSVICVLFMTNLHAMQVSQQLLGSEGTTSFKVTIERLKIWGCSLFSEVLSLDSILQSPESGIDALRRHIVGTLGDIGLIEGKNPKLHPGI
jgi:hypothetical protein